MDAPRRFRIADHLRPSDGDPVRSVVTQSTDAAVVAWHVAPGQRIAAHVHPQGQDTWTIVSGGGDYQVDATGRSIPIAAGDVVVARTGSVHGVLNTGTVPLVFVSVVSPADAGFEPL